MLMPEILNTGKSTSGIIAVAGMGITSVVHHMAIRRAIAAVYHPSWLNPSGEGLIIIITKSNNPLPIPVSLFVTGGLSTFLPELLF